MSIWICLLIPLIGVFVLLRWYKHTLTWWEVAIPSIACFLFILIFKFSVEKIQVDDTEYHGATVVEARYYEYWETWLREPATEVSSVESLQLVSHMTAHIVTTILQDGL